MDKLSQKKIGKIEYEPFESRKELKQMDIRVSGLPTILIAGKSYTAQVYWKEIDVDVTGIEFSWYGGIRIAKLVRATDGEFAYSYYSENTAEYFELENPQKLQLPSKKPVVTEKSSCITILPDPEPTEEEKQEEMKREIEKSNPKVWGYSKEPPKEKETTEAKFQTPTPPHGKYKQIEEKEEEVQEEVKERCAEFTIDLPVELVPTYKTVGLLENDASAVYYQLKFKFYYLYKYAVGGSNGTVTIPFKVWNNTANYLPQDLLSFPAPSASAQKGMRDDGIYLKAALPKGVLQLGEEVEVQVTVINTSSSKIRCIKMSLETQQLVKEKRISDVPRSDKSKRVYKYVVPDTAIAPHSNFDSKLRFKIPEAQHIYPTIASILLQYKYSFRVRADIPLAKDVSVDLDVILIPGPRTEDIPKTGAKKRPDYM